uniref:5-demethoxyubiquinone hydroxylase, mitochondrial n=1 Tax=Schistocephalus solidus TaxID=70667 RepID=A0A0V0J441_SCHSO
MLMKMCWFFYFALFMTHWFVGFPWILLVFCYSSMTRRISSRTKALLDRLIRVDHAGELGAKCIYEGQLAVLKNTKSGPILEHMLEQEKHHLKTFEALIPMNRVRPTALLPIFRVGAYALGVATGLLGEKSAMACTVAVESVVGNHYNDQIRELLQADPKAHAELLEILKQFRDEEMEHHDTGLANEAEMAPFYQYLSNVIKLVSKISIGIAERV